MTRTIFAGIVLGVSALSMACGDDEEDNGGGGGSGGTGGSGMQVTCTPGAGGACQNETDCPSVVDGSARMSAGLRGQQCLGDPDPGTCTVMYIVMDTGMSVECSTCYAALVGCASENCLSECAADPTVDECTQCQIDSGCRGDFDDCSGLMTVP